MFDNDGTARPAKENLRAAGGVDDLSRQPAGGLDVAVKEARAALETLAAVDLDTESDRDLLTAALDLQELANRIAGQQLRVLAEANARAAYGHDGAVTLASWYRARTRLDPPEAHRLVQTGVRLRHLPTLRAALESGQVSVDHAAVITRAAIPRRMLAIQDAEPTLVELARHGTPTDLRRAARMITDLIDPDGTDQPAPLIEHGPDERREFRLHRGLDGLWDARGTLDPIAGEAMATLLDALDTPDPPDTPAERRRSPAQRRADALDGIVQRALRSANLPTVHGAPPHILAIVDLATLAGADDQATITPRLRHGGDIAPATARRLAQRARITAVQTMGPWRAVNVGRTHRLLPSWLRGLMQMLHQTCRGPDCDRPATWTQAHHQTDWAAGGDTDLNQTVPACEGHHDLCTNGGWTVRLDPDTGICTWTGPDGQVIRTYPPTR